MASEYISKVFEALKNRSSLYKIFLIGLAIRLLFIPWTMHIHYPEVIRKVDEVFLFGYNPILQARSHGPSAYLFYLPVYIPWLILNEFGISYQFILNSLIKIPPLIGDVVILYALYEISMYLFNDDRKSSAVSGAFFLNPYAIYMSSIVCVFDNLVPAFLLLSIFFFIKNRPISAGVCFSISSLFRYHTILLFPVFLLVSLQIKPCSDERRILSLKKNGIIFFLSTLFFSLVLLIPIFLSLHRIYAFSPTFLWDYLIEWINPSGHPAGFGIWMFRYNFVGLFMKTGIWSIAHVFFGLKPFLILYAILTMLMVHGLRRKRITPLKFLMLNIITYFSLFMLVIPKVQRFYLVWLFPFLIMASHVLEILPRKYPRLLWITNIVISPIIDGNFFKWFWGIFPHEARLYRGVYLSVLSGRGNESFNVDLQLAVGVLHGLLLLLIVIFCLILFLRKTEN